MNRALYRKRFFSCDCSNPKEFSVEHLFESYKGKVSTFGPWWCDSCGYSWSGRLFPDTQGDPDIDLEKGEYKEDIGVLLKLSVPLEELRFVARIKHLYKPGQPLRGLRYLIEEHNCPTNILSDIEKIFVGTDDDYHGLFEIVAVRRDFPEGWRRDSKSELLEGFSELLSEDENP